MDITFCELRNKEVVNLNDGRKLGRIIDLSLTTSGQVLGLILPSDKGMFKSVVNQNSIFIPWRSIVRLGDDIILVNVPTAIGCS